MPTKAKPRIEIRHIITKASCTIVIPGTDDDPDITRTITSSDERFAEVVANLRGGDHDAVLERLDLATAVNKSSGGRLKWKGGTLTETVSGASVPQAIADHVRTLVAGGSSTAPIEAFWARLRTNPSDNSAQQLYTFLARTRCNIMDDGRFIMYKGVRSDLRSKHRSDHYVGIDSTDPDGRAWTKGTTIDLEHTPGATVRIPRADCSDNRRNDCDRGLHCAPADYARRLYGSGKIVEVIVDPADVVSVPDGGMGEKIRTCRYLVTRVIPDGAAVHDVATVSTKVADTAAGRKLAVRHAAKRAAAKRGGGTIEVVPFTTDRITIPAEVAYEAGIQPSDTAMVALTDPRSRFLLVAATASVASAFLKRPDFVWSATVKTTTKGSVGIRERLLRQLPGDDHDITEYTAKVVTSPDGTNKALEVRPRK